MTLMKKAQQFLDNNGQAKEVKIVDFSEFKGGNQDPIEWLEGFERACNANQVHADRAFQLVESYLKGTALTWFNRQQFQHWDNQQYPDTSFVNLFKIQFNNPFRISQWKHQLRNRKQKPDETIEEYIAAMEELWKRIDSQNNRSEMDRLHEFIEGLRPEFIVPVQSSIPDDIEEAMSKARVLETTFFMGMELTAYSMLPEYLQNMNGGMIPARTNMAMFQSAYTIAFQKQESMKEMVQQKISEGITVALSQMQIEPRSTNSSNESNNRSRPPRNNTGCYIYFFGSDFTLSFPTTCLKN
jgi:hypothetical protein